MKFFRLDDARTMYGMVNTINFSSDNKYTVQNNSCRFCGQPAAMHILHSTLNDSDSDNGTFQLANKLLQKLKELVATSKLNSAFKSPKEKMIGVLKCSASQNIYAGHSGQFSNDPIFAQACNTLNMIYSPAVTRGQIFNRNGSLVNDTEIQNFDYQCAAPRIIQHAISDRAFPLEMTEMCYGGKTEGRVAGSCNRCRKTIPAMLCPTSPDYDRLRKVRIS
jgi:hypothetical protein